MKEEMPGQSIPCLSTWYRHVNAGDVGVRHGETPYHPNRKPKGPRPHPAMTVPGRLVLVDRPAGATNRSRFGHYEMDTVVSSTNGTGGLLVLVDRKSRRYVIEKLEHVTQDEVVKALKRMIRRKALGKARSVTTDNGCEFLDQKRLDRAFKSEVYYTGPTPPTRRARSRTATASSGGGTPRAPTSTGSRGARSGSSRTG